MHLIDYIEYVVILATVTAVGAGIVIACWSIDRAQRRAVRRGWLALRRAR